MWRVLPLLCLGCGYSLIVPDRGPTDRLALGQFVDTSVEGDLGLHAVAVLQARLAGLDRPALVRKGPRLSGVVAVAEDVPLGTDGAGLATAYGVDVTLTAALKEGGAVLWTSGPVRRRAVFVRSGTAAETRGARRAALQQAVSQAADALVDRLLAAPEGP